MGENHTYYSPDGEGEKEVGSSNADKEDGVKIPCGG
jgi:hypothetical protein